MEYFCLKVGIKYDFICISGIINEILRCFLIFRRGERCLISKCLVEVGFGCEYLYKIM